MSLSLTPEQLAEVQAQLGPNQALYPDGTVRDTTTGEIIATLAFDNPEPTQQSQQSIELPADAQQDAHGNIYSGTGQLLYQMTPHGLVAVAQPASQPTVELPPGAQQDASGNIYDASGRMILQMTPSGLVPVTSAPQHSSNSMPSTLSQPSPPPATPPAAPLPAKVDELPTMFAPASDIAPVEAMSRPALPSPPPPPTTTPAVIVTQPMESVALPASLSPPLPPPPPPPPGPRPPRPSDVSSSSNSLSLPGATEPSPASGVVRRAGRRSPQPSPRQSDSLPNSPAPVSPAPTASVASGAQSAAAQGEGNFVYLSADQMPLVPLEKLRGCVLHSDGRMVNATGQLTGWVQPDGVLIAPDGVALGRMPDKAALEMWENGARMMAAQQAEALANAKRDAEAAAAARDAVPDWRSLRARTVQNGAELMRIPRKAMVEGFDELELEEPEADDGLSRGMTLRRTNSVMEIRGEVIQPLSFNEVEDESDQPVPEGVEYGDDGLPLDAQTEHTLDEARSIIPYVSDFVPIRFSQRPPRPIDKVPMHERFAQSEVFIEVFILRRLSINPEQFTFVMLDGLESLLDKKQVKAIGPMLSMLKQTQTLILRYAGLKKLEGLVLPQLVMLDLSHNKITEVNSLEISLRQCPAIQQLNLRDNPICAGGDWKDQFPSASAKVWKALVFVPTLEVLNGVVIPNSVRAPAFERASPKALRQRVPDLLFNIAVNQSSRVLEMESWQPFQIERINLGSQALTIAHLGSFKGLLELNLSYNRLPTLQGLGLEQCVRLRRLAVTHNALTKANNYASIQPLAYLPALRELWLSNNEGLGTKYADAAICITRNARGTRRSPGLQLIDGRAITLEDRLKALAVRGVNAAGIEAERWKLTLIASFGHSRVAKGTDFFERARSALFSDAGLSGSVDVSIFRSLLKLDLERNRVREIRGLESLICLRVCLLAGNPELETKKVLSQLKPHVGLEHLSIRPKPEKEKADLGFLKRILIALPQADRLCMIDGVSISAADRMAIVSETVKFSSPRDLCAYNVNLALLIASSPVQGRDYNPQSIVARRGVVNHAIQQLYGLSGLHLRIDDLVSVQCDFRSFTRLERLDLSRNAIDDVSALGLSSLPSLMWLDLRDNKIATPIPQLAAQIDAIPSLQVIALRGNPCLSSDSEKRQKANRLALLGSMQRVRSVDCSLRVLDTEITVNERVEAWQAGGLSAAEAETLRAQIALYVRTPTGALQQPASVLTLDLSGLDLLFVPLVSFTRLERLCLRGNRLQKVSGLGLEACTSLVSLDLRDNKLTSCNDIAVVCSSLKSLRALACCAGNIALGDNDADIRRAVISSLTMLCEPSCALRYLDEALLTVDEICEAHLNGALGGRREAAEMLRFALTLRRRLEESQGNDKPPELLATDAVDLSEGNFESVQGISSMARLKRLNLDNNRLSSTALQKADLPSLRYLEVLSLRNNQFANIKTLAAILDSMPSLRIVHLTGNRSFQENTSESRIELLKHMHRNSKPKFSLSIIDGVPITVAERITALQEAGAADTYTLEQIRLTMSLERMNADPSRTISLDLKHSGLSNIAPLSVFVRLEVLSLHDNCLTSLSSQGLGSLPALRELDIRRNKLESMSDVLDGLSKCHSLQVLWLAGAIPGKTDGPVESYASEVCSRLRGLVTLDGIKNPLALKPIQRDAQEFLWQVAQIGPNQLHSIDVSDQQIPSTLFFYFLAALAELRMTQTLIAHKNPWHVGVTRVPNYRAYIIYVLGEHLQSLDGEPVIADELRNALQTIEKEQEDGRSGLIKGGWRACRERAQTEARQFRIKRNAALAAKRRRGSVAGPAAISPIKQGISTSDVVLGVSGVFPSTVGGGGNPDDEEQNDDGQMKDLDDDLMDEDEAKNEADDGPGFWDTGGAANDAELAANVDQVWSTMASITGNILTKAEIIISYFQLYALYLVIDLHIPWPQIWLAFSRFVYFFSFNINIAFDFTIPYREQIEFGILASVPLMFYLFYVTVDRMKSDKWIERYSNEWISTRRKAFVTWVVFIILVLFGALFYDYPVSYNLVLSGHFPQPNTSGLVLVCWGIVTFFALIWYMVVSNFRKNYVGVDHHEFIKWWLERTFILRKAMLFMLTICFMPASRIVLEQFTCRNGRLVAFPDQLCFPQAVSVIQILAFIFGVLYILGIPIFFFRLISQGTNVVAKAGFETRGAELRAEIARLKGQREKFQNSAWKAKEYDDAIEEYESYLKTLWANEVVKNPLPQTYLYAAYEQKWKYYKIFQMVQKLSVLVVTNFVPASDIATLKIWCGTALQFGFAGAAIFVRPFSDGFESMMDISSQVANFVNVFAALGISLSFISQYTSTITLFVINIGGMALMALNLFATPIRACIAQRELLERAAKVALEAAAADAEALASSASGAVSGAAAQAISAVPLLSGVSDSVHAATSQVSSVVSTGYGAVASAASSATGAVGRVASAGVDAASSSANRIGSEAIGLARSFAVAAPDIEQQALLYGREGLDAASQMAPLIDSTIAEGAHFASDGVHSGFDAAINSSYAAKGAAYVKDNVTTVAEAIFEQTVATHSTSQDVELTERFENKDGSAKVPWKAAQLMRDDGGFL